MVKLLKKSSDQRVTTKVILEARQHSLEESKNAKGAHHPQQTQRSRKGHLENVLRAADLGNNSLTWMISHIDQ